MPERSWEIGQCPDCGRVSSVPAWCKRPICVHAWDHLGPEIWDGDDTDGEGRHMEWSPNETLRSPGPNTWAELKPVEVAPASRHVEMKDGKGRATS